MRAKTVKGIPSFDDLYASAPGEIKDYITKCGKTPQGTDWHPEGNVGIHVRLVYDRAAEYGDINLAVAAFFHDLGKVDTTAKNKRGGWSAIGHERVSANLVDRNSDWISELGANPAEVHELVFQHMRIKQFDDMKGSKKQILRDNPLFGKLNQFTKCDDMTTLTPEELKRYESMK